MESQYLKNAIEAALLAAGRPLDVEQLRELFEEYERPPAAEVRDCLVALAAEYEGRGLQLVEIASGWRAQVRAEFSGPVSRLWQERPTRYSRALLEILALIAYRQPITRAEIEDVRGVAVNPNIVRTLSERGWIRVVGHREVPGRPELLGTTRELLDYFGLKSLDQLPTLADLKDMDNVGVQLDFGETVTAELEPEAHVTHEAGAQEAEVDPDTSTLREAANDPDVSAT
jgi:segregation and condensation protein B